MNKRDNSQVLSTIQSRNKVLLEVPSKVNRYQTHVLVDSGVTHNFVDSGVADKMHPKQKQYKPGEQAVQLGNGSMCSVKAQTSDVPVDTDEWSTCA